MRARRGVVLGIGVAAASLAGPARAQTDSLPPWQLVVGADAGAPSGWVAVRENAIAGTRLSFRPDLGVKHVLVYTLGIARRLGARTRLAVTVAGTSLEGRATPAHDVTFNGATLEAGTSLRTAVGVSRFVTGTIAVEQRVVALGRGWLWIRGGITFTGLTFVLQGTLAPGSAHHETQEDFVTQELPVPLGGVTARLPVAPRLSVFVDLDGSGIPRVNSLRREGGEVTLRQAAGSLTAGLDYALHRAVRVALAYRSAAFVQHEQSAEDGNDIALHKSTVALRLTLDR